MSGAATQAIGMAQNAASTPFNLPTAPVAGFTPDQQQAFQQYQQLQGSAQPYYNQANQYINQSAQPISASQVANYYNPMASSVLGQLQNTQQQQMASTTGNLTQQAGGVGANRIAVGQGILANQQNLATGATAAGLYQNALTAAQQQQQSEANAGYASGNLGTSVLNANLTGTNALATSGATQQAQQQNVLNAGYQNQLAQLAYPFQTAQYLAGIAGGLGPTLGGTTSGESQTTQPAPSLLSQILGGITGAVGTAGATGAFGSNGWLTGATGSGSTPSYTSATPNYGQTSNLNLGNYSMPTFRRGGAAYASGGSAGSGASSSPYSAAQAWMSSGDPTIPDTSNMHFQSGQGQLMKFNTPPAAATNNTGAQIGQALASAGKVAMMFAKDGGVVDGSVPFQSFADGGQPQYYGGPDVVDPNVPTFAQRNGDLPPAVSPLAAAAQGALPSAPATGAPWMPPSYQDAAPAGPTANADGSVTPADGAVGSPSNPFRNDVSSQDMQNWRSGTPVVAADSSPADGGQPGMPSAPGNATSLGAPGNSPAAPMGNAQISAPDQSLPYPDLDQKDDTSRSFAKNPWMALANAGFAMMAGTSPFAGVNIGKGLQAGVQTLETQRKDLATEEGVNQRAKQLIQQAQQHADQYNKMTPYQTEEIKLRQQQIAQQAEALKVRGWVQTSENPVDGSKTFVNKGTMETRTVYADGRVENGSMNDPGATAKKTSSLPTPDNTPSGTKTPPEAAPLHQPELASNLVPPKIDNISDYRKGSPALAQANKENTATTQLHTKEANNMGSEELLVGNSKQAFGTLMKDADQDGFLTKMATMRGNNIDERIRYARSINEAARAAGKPPIVDPNKLAAMEVIQKDQKTLGMLFASNLSSREAFAGQQVGIESTPGLTQSPQGMLRLLAGYDAQLQYTKDKHAFYENYLQTNHGIPTGWREAFEQQNPPERYMVRSMMENLPNRKASQMLPEAVQVLRDHKDDQKVIDAFNKNYGNTASYWLTGKLDLLGAQ